jgi:hypothetical protein
VGVQTGYQRSFDIPHHASRLARCASIAPRHCTLLAFLAVVLFYYQALCVCLSIMINLFIVLVGTLAAFSFADADPHLRKDFKSLLSSAQENHNDSLGRTLEANKDRILKLVRHFMHCLC